MIDAMTQKGLERGEIITHVVGFVLAGYETTSTTLAFATYLLATHPEVQERLANEIHEYFEENTVSVTPSLFSFNCLFLVYIELFSYCPGQVHV